MTKLIIALRNFATALKNQLVLTLYTLTLLNPTGYVMHQLFNFLNITGYVMHL